MSQHTYPYLKAVDFFRDSGLKLAGTSARELRWCFRDHRVTIGRGTYGDPTIILYSAEDRVEIGNYSSLAAHCVLLAGGEHSYRTTSSFPFRAYHGDDPGVTVSDPTQIRYQDAVYKGPLRLGSDVWIGTGALILSGLTVGHGAVVGAGTVVASDVPPYSIVVGNPNRVLKYRFDDDVIEGLLASRWWDWDPKWIQHYRHRLLGDPRDFLDDLAGISHAELNSYYGTSPNDDRPEIEQISTVDISRETRFKMIVRNICPPILYRGIVRTRSALRSR